jgi:stringent starvation protein B
VQDGQIVLNIAPRAVTNYSADNVAVSFSARFSGVPENIYVPFPEVMAIYAAENGQGMVFSHEPESSPEPPEGGTDDKAEKKPADDGKPFLKVIK